ncbi:MAG: hypothetical protein F6J90_38615 [Moorea sp. SIOASIH]|nr:hypothetical protein [Moorena sp. SIOASIH]
MGILVELASCVEWASWWNWHLASFMLIFERAGCPLYSYPLLDSATPKILCTL